MENRPIIRMMYRPSKNVFQICTYTFSHSATCCLHCTEHTGMLLVTKSSRISKLMGDDNKEKGFMVLFCSKWENLKQPECTGTRNNFTPLSWVVLCVVHSVKVSVQLWVSLTSFLVFLSLRLFSYSTIQRANRAMMTPCPRSPNITANRNGKVMTVKGARNDKRQEKPLRLVSKNSGLAQYKTDLNEIHFLQLWTTEMFSSLSPELNAGYVITSCHKWDYYKITRLSLLFVCFWCSKHMLLLQLWLKNFKSSKYI